MTSILNQNSELIGALGLTILHSLWQALLLAGLLWSVSRVTRRAQLRYALAYGTLLLQLLLSGFTFFWLYEPAAGMELAGTGTTLFLEITVAETNAGWWNPAAFLFWVVVFWVAGLVIGTVRLSLSFGRVRRMQRAAAGAVPTAFRAIVSTLADRIGYRGPLHLRVSRQIDGPALIGHFKPLLLFPVAVINQLTPDQAEAVILHELAHLKRQDHWWNLLQCIIEVIFYYHPVIWWIGARIREEREHCCDDLVLRHGPDRLAYAKALLYFENQRATPATAVALTNNPTGLLGRVKRFLHQQNIPYQMKSRLFLLPLLTLLALVSTAVYAPTVTEDLPAVTSAATTETSSATDLAPKNLSLAPAPAPAIFVTPELPTLQPDTLPAGRHTVSSYRNGKSTKVVVEDSEIKALEIDGRVIPATEFDEHQAMVERLFGVENKVSGTITFEDGQDWEGGDEMLELNLRSLEALKSLRSLESLKVLRGLKSLESLESLNGMDAIGFGELDSLENLGGRWEKIGIRLGEMGDRIGRSFEGLLDHDGQITRFHWDSEEGEPYIFEADSLPAGSILKFRSDSDNLIIRDNMMLEADKIEYDSAEDELREMETMIEKLERRKAAVRREIEQSKQREKGEMVRELEGQARVLRNQERARAEELREDNRPSAAESREAVERLLAEARAEGIPDDYEKIITSLQAEGLLEGNAPLKKLSVDNDSLRVNGKKASTAAHQRFLELYRQYKGTSPGSKFSVKVNKG